MYFRNTQSINAVPAAGKLDHFFAVIYGNENPLFWSFLAENWGSLLTYFSFLTTFYCDHTSTKLGRKHSLVTVTAKVKSSLEFSHQPEREKQLERCSQECLCVYRWRKRNGRRKEWISRWKRARKMNQWTFQRISILNIRYNFILLESSSFNWRQTTLTGFSFFWNFPRSIVILSPLSLFFCFKCMIKINLQLTLIY